MKKIVLTGGGTAGHVTPNLALVPELKRRGFDIHYVGSVDGMEKGLAWTAGLPYTGVSVGKLRRYNSVENLKDPFRVIKGIHESRAFLKEYQPDVVFSKGGYVGAPVVAAARELKIPVVLHEADLTPGLANKLCFPAASRVLCNFPETLEYLPAGISEVTGCPIREELRRGSREAGLAFSGLKGEKPVLMCVGGSLGAANLNKALWSILPRLLEHFEVLHLCGKGKTDPAVQYPGYVQFEYVGPQLKDLFALADIVISRAGANAICELVALQKPNLLVPLSTAASRGDQILNARSFEKQGFSLVLEEQEITPDGLFDALLSLYERRGEFRQAMAGSGQGAAVSRICDILEEVMLKRE